MKFRIKTMNEVIVVNITGELDGKTAREIRQQILSQSQAGSKVLIDMSRVKYMTSSGLRMLLSTYRQVKEDGGRIVLVGFPEEVQDIMAVTGFLSHFTTTCPTVNEGLTLLQEEEK